MEPISRVRLRGLAATAVALTAAIVVPASPASASSHRPCTIEKHSTTSGVTKVGSATATVGTDGIKLTTAAAQNPDKVSWQTSFRPVAAGTVTEMSYETMKLDTAGDGVNNAAVPAYQIFVRTPAGEGTLVYEPYQAGPTMFDPPRNLRIEWDVMQGKLWTPSTTITGMTKTAGGPSTQTFAQVVAANPRMTVTGIGFGLGTYNPGVISVLDEQRFATKNDCTEHQWSTGFKTGGWWPGWLRRA